MCDQEVVEYFVRQAPRELVQLEHWGCPWSREDDGSVAVRPFGGMKKKRTWYAADKSGFHILHTLFQTSLQFPTIERYDEFFALDLLHRDGECRGVVAMEMRSGRFFQFNAPVVILATGGGTLPALRHSTSLTTRSPAALRAYLEGEASYRRADFASASDAFRRAVAEDSTFALANLRLSRSLGWLRNIGDREGGEALVRARAHEGRLPPREAEYLRVEQQLDGQDPRAFGAAVSVARSYPDDPVQIWTQGQGEDNRHWLPSFD